jgi:hypothetical protein
LHIRYVKYTFDKNLIYATFYKNHKTIDGAGHDPFHFGLQEK